MSVSSRYVIALLLLALTFPITASAIVIDEFSGSVPFTTTSTSSTTGNPIGGEIDYVNVVSTSFEEASGIAILAKTAGRTGSALLDYDGIDGSPIPGLGLGGIDLTDGGSESAFVLDLVSVTGSVLLGIEVWNDGIGFASTGSIVIDRPGRHVVPFQSFLGGAAFRGFGDINRLTFSFSDFETGESLAITSVATVPEPSQAVLLSFGLALLARTQRRPR
jgi:hypothetical protein